MISANHCIKSCHFTSSGWLSQPKVPRCFFFQSNVEVLYQIWFSQGLISILSVFISLGVQCRMTKTTFQLHYTRLHRWKFNPSYQLAAVFYFSCLFFVLIFCLFHSHLSLFLQFSVFFPLIFPFFSLPFPHCLHASLIGYFTFHHPLIVWGRNIEIYQPSQND